MFNWSAKEQLPILKTVGGLIHTMMVPYMQYFAKKWPSSKAGILFSINYQKKKFSKKIENVIYHITNKITIHYKFAHLILKKFWISIENLSL